MVHPAENAIVDCFLELVAAMGFAPEHSPPCQQLVTCGSHFGGEASAGLLRLALTCEWLRPTRAGRFVATPRLQSMLRRIAAPPLDLPSGRLCEDHRHPTHLGGALGAALSDIAIEQKWITRMSAGWSMRSESALMQRIARLHP